MMALMDDRTCTSSIYTTTYEQITAEFGVSQLVATLGLSTFIFGLGIGPLFLAPLSEVRCIFNRLNQSINQRN